MDAQRFMLQTGITLIIIYVIIFLWNAHLDNRKCYVQGEWLYCQCDADPRQVTDLRSGKVKITRMITFAKDKSKDNYLHSHWAIIGPYNPQHIKQLYIYNCIARNDIIDEIISFENLQMVKLFNVSVYTLDFDTIVSVRKLTVDTSTLGKFIGDPSECKRLEQLTLNDTALRSLPLHQLKELPALRELHASGPFLKAHHNYVCDRLPDLEFYNGASCAKRFGYDQDQLG